ncbi:MAG: UMP kinase [Candidatus Electryonea clarkiae]|nr:UMP kinase [Candidatus Electryonea clarkiae]MDP8288741.1 UMP kinase [Candidatus Electryonea clarkiae]
MPEFLYKRILLKLSGESLAGPKKYGLSEEVLNQLSEELKEVMKSGIQLGIVVGGGNIFRGLKAAGRGMARVPADHMGMLATVINAVALQNYLENAGVQTRVLSAITVDEIAEPYIRRRAIRHLEKGRIVIFAAGTGNPFFTSDTAAALRASEIGAEALVKGTRVDGIYDKDPEKHEDAKILKNVTFSKILETDIRVMDLTAITFCKDNCIPVRVFNMTKPGNLLKLLWGEDIGSIATN